MADYNDLQHQLTQAKSNFTESKFAEYRQTWDKLLERNLPTVLPAEVTGSQEGLDYQSADLEDALVKHRATLMMNPTMFDVAMMDEAPTIRAIGSDILRWTARTWEQINHKRWWDAHTGEGQVRHGVAGSVLRWHEYKEPDTEDLAERESSMKKRRQPFYLKPCDIYGLYWVGDDPIDGPDVVFYEYEQSYISACEEYHKNGEYLTLDSVGKVGWLEVDTSKEDAEQNQNKKVKIVVRDGRKLDGSTCPLEGCTHPQRSISVYICGPDQELNEDLKADEYDSPFINSSYILTGGNILYSAKDPHNRYRPLMLPMYVEVAWQNYIRTLLATASRQDYGDEDLYINMSNAPDWAAGWMQEKGADFTFQKPKPGSGEIAAYPGEVARFPKNISQHLQALLEESNKHLVDYQPNRFLTGNANTEASNATGTAFIQQVQAAGLPYNPLLSESDASILRIFQNIFHGIKFFAMSDAEGAPTNWYAVTSGAENLMRSESSPGQVVFINAEKLSHDFDLLLRTKSETLAEEGARWLQAKDQYTAGVLPFDKLLRAAGADDVELTKQQLFKDRVRAGFQPRLEQIINMTIERGIEALSGIPISQLGPVQPAGGQGFSNPAPTGSGSPTTPPNSIQGRSIQQAVIQNPDSGGGQPGQPGV